MRHLVRYYLFVIAAWVGAWYLHDLTAIRDLSSRGQVGYWTLAKVVVWIAPILLIVTRLLKQSATAYLGLVRFQSGVRVGLAVSGTFVALAALLDLFTRSYAVPDPTWGTLSALTVAPMFEEIMFRGFALKTLEEAGYRFWPANVIAAFLFLGLHLPGWQFMGGLGASSLINGVSVVIIGLVAGFAKHRAQSTWASVTVHFVNNVYSAFVR